MKIEKKFDYEEQKRYIRERVKPETKKESEEDVRSGTRKKFVSLLISLSVLEANLKSFFQSAKKPTQMKNCLNHFLTFL